MTEKNRQLWDRKRTLEVSDSAARPPILTVRTLAMAGVFAALITLATQLRIPTGIGYVNLGDGMILACAFLLGPVALFPAAIGSALADLIAGYAVFMLPTFLIKGLMGLLVGLLLGKGNPSMLRISISFLCAELLMVSGYFVTEILLFDWSGAVGSVIPNLWQGAAGIAMGIALCPAVRRLRRRA